MDYKRLFLNWLKHYHIKQKFLFNCQTVRSAIGTKRCYPIQYIWKEDPIFYLINSFIWRESDQGYHFWSVYDDLWRNYLDKYRHTHPRK